MLKPEYAFSMTPSSLTITFLSGGYVIKSVNAQSPLYRVLAGLCQRNANVDEIRQLFCVQDTAEQANVTYADLNELVGTDSLSVAEIQKKLESLISEINQKTELAAAQAAAEAAAQEAAAAAAQAAEAAAYAAQAAQKATSLAEAAEAAQLAESAQHAAAQAAAAAPGTCALLRRFSLDSDGNLSYGIPGQPSEVIPPKLVMRVKEAIAQGHSLEPLKNFLDRLLQNPSYRIRAHLYDFLIAGDVPLTPDGMFLAYKAVRHDYLDIYTGTIDNRPGSRVTMDRSKVDDDPNRTCSAGLHVCSRDYLPSFSHANGHVVICMVDPADVVSIPADYHNTKMRCCAYTVVGEWDGYYTSSNTDKHFLGQSRVMTGSEAENDEPYIVRYLADGANSSTDWIIIGTAQTKRIAYAMFNGFVDETDIGDYIVVQIYDRHADNVVDSEEGDGFLDEDDSDGDRDSDDDENSNHWVIYGDQQLLSEYGPFITATEAITTLVNDPNRDETVVKWAVVNPATGQRIAIELEN